MFYLTWGRRIKKDNVEILRQACMDRSDFLFALCICNFIFPQAIFRSTLPDLRRIITIEFDADRTIWPLCDNTDITSRYHSSADKAAGSRIPPKSPFEANNPAETERDTAVSQWRQPDVKEVILVEDIYGFLLVPVFEG